MNRRTPRPVPIRVMGLWRQGCARWLAMAAMAAVAMMCWPQLQSAFANANTWTSKTPLATARAGLACAEINGKLYAVGGAASTVLNTLEVYDPLTGTWTAKAPMPTARLGHAAIAINGKLYAVGGFTSAGAVGTLEVYDPATDTWTSKTSMPTARFDFGAAAINGKLYAAGGAFNIAFGFNTLEVYDPATDVWTSKAVMPTARYALGAAAIDGKLYAVGGFKANSGGDSWNVLEVYDPATNAWTTKASMPKERYYFGIAAVEGKLHVAGGADNGFNLNNHEIYDPVTDTWTINAALPGFRYGLAAAAVNGKFYAVGGLGSSYLKTVEVYETPEPNAWTGKALMPTARFDLAAVEINGKLYAIGGNLAAGVPYSNALEVYDPATGAWISKANMPTARYDLGATEINGKLYAVSGLAGTFQSALEVYDPATNSWTAKAPIPTPRTGLKAVTINGKLYAIGGSNFSGFLATLEAYDPMTNTWETKTPMPTPRANAAAAVLNGRLYVAGGYNLDSGGFTTLEVYDPATDAWETKAPMPFGRLGAAAGVVDGKLYLAGGKLGFGVGTDSLQIYDPATDSWTSSAPMPTPRYGLGAAAINGKLYAVGGLDGFGASQKLEVFQVSSNLSLAKTHAGNFPLGANGSYTLTVTNAALGNSTTGPITVTDTLPASLSFVSAAGAGWNCSASGQVVTCTNNSLTLVGGESASFTLNVHAGTPGSVINNASVSTPDEIQTNDNDASDPTLITCPAITATVGGGGVVCANGSANVIVTVSGGLAPYTVSLTNGGGVQTGAGPVFVFTVSPAATTIYTLASGTDANGCPISGSGSATVSYSNLGFSVQTINPSCHGANNGQITIHASGNNGAVMYSKDNGQSFQSSSVFNGLAAGNYFPVVKDALGCSKSGSAVLTSPQPVAVAPASLAAGSAGVAFPTTAFTASGGTGVFSFSLTGTLPAGMSFNAATGTLSGTPLQTGSFSFTVTATDAKNCTGIRNYTLGVVCPAITLNPASLAVAMVNTAYSQTVGAVPGGAAYDFAMTSGALPPGLSLSNGGVISGAPMQSGTFNFRITATGAAACSGFRDYQIAVSCAGTVTLGAIANGTAGIGYSQTISALPTGSHTFSLAQGNLPSGLTLHPSTGVISGMPAVTGTSNFIVKAQTPNGCDGTRTYALTIACPAITLSTLPTPGLNQTYNQSISASPAGGNYSFAISSGSLPPGFSLNTATGVVTGTATQSGTYAFTVTVTGFGSCAGSRAYSFAIGGGCPTVSLPELSGGSVGQFYNQSVAASPSSSYSYSVSGDLPPGLQFYGAVGMLYGYPTVAGTYSFTVTATNASNCAGSRQYWLTFGGASQAKQPQPKG